jgi:asparagine synthase (glutamine-hydrolysing)
MSGIAGAFRLRSLARRDSVSLVRRMLAVLAHRGPGQIALFRSGADKLVLGECRHADATAAPEGEVAANEAETIRAILDGEFYNGRALRHGLEFDGHRLRGDADAELMIHSFEQHGLECLGHLNGRFALALWDDRFDRLILARDRLGKKPLYFVIHDDLLLFASEIKALTAAAPFRRRIDPVAMQQFLTWGFVAPPLTMFQGVGKLGAGEALVVEPGGMLRRTAWWRPCRDSRKVARIRTLPADQHRSNLRSLLDHSLADRVGGSGSSANQPPGCLMGGAPAELTLAGQAARMLGRTLEAVCVHADDVPPPGQPGEAVDLIAVALRPQDVIEALPDLVRHLDEPVADLTAPFLWRGAQVLRSRGITAALTVDGVDALVPEPPSPPPTRRAGLLAWLTGRARRPGDDEDVGPFALADLQHLMGPAVTGPARLAANGAWGEALPEVPPWLGDGDASRAALALRGTLPEARLMRADKMAMAHGIELRAPFLDHQLVDYVLALRGTPGGDALLVEMFGDSLTDGDSAAAVGRWLAGELGACYEQVVSRSRLIADGLLDGKACLDLLVRHREDGGQAARLWAVLMLAEWYDLFWVDNDESAPAPSLPWPGHSAAAE